MAEFQLSRSAEESLRDIYHYTYLSFGEKQADKYLLELEAVFETLADYPKVGKPYQGKTRFFVHGKHIILYRIQKNCILIGKIFHGSRRR